MEEPATLTYEREGVIGRITLNRPERGNGITLEMPAELAAAVEEANLDPRIHVIALAGNGTGFCGGYDLTAAERMGPGGPATAGEGAESAESIRPSWPPITIRRRSGTRSSTSR